jgi:hypothetical protein
MEAACAGASRLCIRARATLVLAAVVVLSAEAADASSYLPDPEAAAYARPLTAGGSLSVAKDSEVTGDAHANGAVALSPGVLIDGDLSAAGNIALHGAMVTGTVTPFAPSQPLPVLPSAAEARTLADRVFEGNRSFPSGTVIDDVVFVAGQARFLGSINGTGSVIAGGQIRFDNVTPGQPAVLEAGTRLSFVSMGSLWVGKGRKLRGELVAAGAAQLRQGLELEGLVAVRGSLAVHKDSVITYSPPVGEAEDVEPPEITPVTPAPGGFVPGPAPLVSAAFSDEGSGVDPTSVRLLVDGVDLTSEAEVSAEGITWVAVEPLAEGLHLVAVDMADLAGNPAEASWAFTVDLTPPSVAVIEPAEGVVVGSATPAILVTYDDALSGVDLTSVAITVDGIDLTSSCAVGSSDASCTAPPLDSGGHTVVAEVHDRAGQARVAESSFVVDAESPVVSITAPGDGATVNTPTVEVTGTATDDGSLVSVVVNGFEAARTGDQFAATVALAEGFNGLLAVATDSIGNEGVASGTVVLDTVAPEVRLETPASGQLVNGATVRVAGEVIDNRGVAIIGVNGEDAALVDGRFEATAPLAEGANVLTVTAIDFAGNVTEATREVTRFTVPDVAITSPEDLAYIAATTVTVGGMVSEGVLSVTVNGVAASLSGTTFEAEGVPLIEGGNTVTATATGALARVGTDTIHVVRDLTPPRVAIYRPAAGEVVHEPAVAVSGLVNDIVPGTVNESEAVVTVNGVPAQVSNRSFFAPEVSLLPGENVLVVTAIDASGNTAAAEVRVHFEPPAGARLRVVSGDQQTVEIGTALPDPLVVELFDAAGQPVADRPVAFYLRGNNGSLEDGRRRVVAVTDGSGRAAVSFTLGTRAGVANQVVEASAPGFSGPVTFIASALPAAPAEIVVDSGGLQVGVAGYAVPRPLIAAVIDNGHNRLEGVPVLFRVVEGAGHFANGEQELEVATDSDGRAIVTFTLDPDEGIANNVVEAIIAALEDGPKASFVASGRAAGRADETSISGVVLDNTNQPIAGATLRVKGTLLTGVTDAEGLFRIEDAPVGAVKLIVDGSTVDRAGSWPDLEFDLVTIPGRDNTVNMPIYLLPLDLGSGLFVDETHGGILTLEDYPGFALEIAPGSVTFPGGGRSGQVSVTVVHNDKVPMVPNFGQQPRMIVTIQPAGARFEPPARLTLPNVEGLVAGQVTEMYSFDHDLGHFVSIGPATVSDDATVIVADPGVGIVKAGWHCGGDPAVFGTAHDCPECEICSFNRCVGIDGLECADDGDLCTLDGCSGGACIHTPKRCDDCTSCFLGDCLADPGEDGNLCNDNPCTRCDNGLCDPVLDGPVTASANGASFVEAEFDEPISFMVTFDETECPEGATVRWNLGDGSFDSGNPITYAYKVDGTFTVSAEVRCPPCPAKRTASVAVAIYEVQMKLEKVETTISDDGSYSEDTEVRVTAVKSTSGEQLFDFTGTVQLEELTEPPIYTQNGGSLPTSVDISFSGTNTFVAKSLAGAIAEGHPPSDAQIRTGNFPLYQQGTFAIPQWVDDQVHDPLISGQAFDWFERRLIDIRTNASGSLAGVLAHISGFVVESLPSLNGFVDVDHADQHAMHLNPYELEMRLDSDYGPRCGRPQSRLMSYTVTHEARHAYQLALSVQDLQSPEDLPGPPEEPNNDDDQDFLVDQSPIPPGNIFIDSTAARNACQVFADHVFSISFSGDSTVDSFQLRAGPALEYDAFTFAAQNAP